MLLMMFLQRILRCSSLLLMVFGVHDTGFVTDPSTLDRDSVSAVRTANPLYGQHFGFDMTRNSVQSGSMRIWRGGFHQSIDAVINGEVRSVGVPRISMVELGQNLYHVSPFGKVLNLRLKTRKPKLPIGSTIERWISLQDIGGKFLKHRLLNRGVQSMN